MRPTRKPLGHVRRDRYCGATELGSETIPFCRWQPPGEAVNLHKESHALFPHDKLTMSSRRSAHKLPRMTKCLHRDRFFSPTGTGSLRDGSNHSLALEHLEHVEHLEHLEHLDTLDDLDTL
jgi:hypothetical protein